MRDPIILGPLGGPHFQKLPNGHSTGPIPEGPDPALFVVKDLGRDGHIYSGLLDP